jgi:phage tail protein X
MTTEDVETYLVEGDGVVLDLILWRRYQRNTKDLLERTLDLNPGLADLGVFIPDGTRVMLPIDKPKTQTVLKLVKLWD